MNLEHDLIRWLRKQTAAHPAVELGIGDDAALLRPSELTTVVTTDLLSDRIDFILDEVPAEDAGYKALAVNLSDLAAMAARPTACFVSLLLPTGPRPPLELAKALYRGLLPLADRFNCALAGGDTNTWDGGLVISVTAMGSVTDRGPLTRSGARPGDCSARHRCLRRQHPRPPPPLHTPCGRSPAAGRFRYELHAGLDVSDGLALDLHRMCEASRCGAVLDRDAVPVSDDARRAQLSDPAARRSTTPWATAKTSSCCWPCLRRKPTGSSATSHSAKSP